MNNALTLLTTKPSQPHSSTDDDSSSSSSSLLCYYGISATWFRNALPFLMYRFRPEGVTELSAHWKEQLGPLDNTLVLQYLEEDITTPSAERSASNSSLFPQQLVLVGANVWLLLSKKFGTTGPAAVPLPVQYSHSVPPHTWVVRLSATRPPVPIPFNGRFPYEQILASPPPPQILVEEGPAIHHDHHPQHSGAHRVLDKTERLSDEDEDDLVRFCSDFE